MKWRVTIKVPQQWRAGHVRQYLTYILSGPSSEWELLFARRTLTRLYTLLITTLEAIPLWLRLLEYAVEIGTKKETFIQNLFRAMDEAPGTVAPKCEWSDKLVDLVGFQWVTTPPPFFSFNKRMLKVFLKDMCQPRRDKKPIIGTLLCSGCIVNAFSRRETTDRFCSACG